MKLEGLMGEYRKAEIVFVLYKAVSYLCSRLSEWWKRRVIWDVFLKSET